MERKELFKFLPSEIINDILLRLPARSIASSKCVCKPWFHLLKTDEFAKSHRERSSPCLAVLMRNKHESSRCSVYELDEEIDAHDVRHHNHLTTFDFPQGVAVLGSANGLLLLLLDDFYTGALYVCNPISHEYIDLNCPPFFFDKVFVRWRGYLPVNYGFGVSKVSGQYKVVRIMESDNHCQVYTLGTGSWRRVKAAAHDLTSFEFGSLNPHAIINGNLHWLVQKLVDNNTPLIICFDLETECFSTFSHLPIVTSNEWIGTVFTLRDCLCLCDHTLFRDSGTFDIWLMKEYGVEKSWTKEYVINFTPDFDTTRLYCGTTPIKIFKNGDILMEWDHDLLFYYSNKMKTIQQFGGPDDIIYTHTSAVLFTPSFLSLRSFGMENVYSLDMHMVWKSVVVEQNFWRWVKL